MDDDSDEDDSDFEEDEEEVLVYSYIFLSFLSCFFPHIFSLIFFSLYALYRSSLKYI